MLSFWHYWQPMLSNLPFYGCWNGFLVLRLVIKSHKTHTCLKIFQHNILNGSCNWHVINGNEVTHFCLTYLWDLIYFKNYCPDNYCECMASLYHTNVFFFHPCWLLQNFNLYPLPGLLKDCQKSCKIDITPFDFCQLR